MPKPAKIKADSDNLDYSLSKNLSEEIVTDKFIIKKYRKPESIIYRLCSISILSALASGLALMIFIYIIQVIEVPFINAQMDYIFEIVGV